MSLLLLIRHGLTDVTGLRLTGWTRGVHLSESGREQAASLPDRLDRVPLAAIYSSPLERCRETAEPLAAARSREVRILDGVGEVRYGSWTNRPLKSLARTALWRRVQTAPSGVRFPGGETLLEVQQRAVGELARVAAAHRAGTVAVVSHADVIKLLLAHYAGVPLDLFQRLVIDPASISAVAVGDGIPRILHVNDRGSLDHLARQRPAKTNVGG
jgi:probable phosphomutase (TIGR03848 family)